MQEWPRRSQVTTVAPWTGALWKVIPFLTATAAEPGTDTGLPVTIVYPIRSLPLR